MAKRNVVWTKTADLQFEGILTYWAKRNKSNSYPLKLIDLVSERTQQIAENPFKYKSTDFKDVRKASMGNFTIYFKIADKQIIVFAFWDNRQDPKKTYRFFKKQIIASKFDFHIRNYSSPTKS